jgi:hypothetical protein
MPILIYLCALPCYTIIQIYAISESFQRLANGTGTIPQTTSTSAARRRPSREEERLTVLLEAMDGLSGAAGAQ